MKRSTIYLLIITVGALFLGLCLFLSRRVFKTSIEFLPHMYILPPLSEDQAALSLKELFGNAIIENGGAYIYRATVVEPNTPYSLQISLPIVSEGEKS